MKKIMTLILAAALCLTALVGCGDNAGTDSNNYDSKTYKVAVVQQLDHSSLNEIRDAIEAELDAAPEGVTVTYENFNGQNDSTVLNQIGSQIVSGGYDAIIPIGTLAAQCMANAADGNIPVIYAAISDPETAGLTGLDNVTGTSDMNPVKEQIDLLLKIKPDAKTIGTVYCSSEVNSEVQVKAMKEYAESKGLTVKIATISTVNDIQQAAQSLIGSVDAFYEPTDNIIASAMPTLIDITNATKVPVICGEPNMVKAGGLATYGIDYYKLGVQTGHMAADILEGKKPASMPIEMAKDLKVTVNKANAALLGITFPEDVLKDADVIE